MRITYWSHSCVFIETSSHRLAIDPFLSGNPLAKTKVEDVQCDYVLITHGHFDHVGDAVDIARQNNATVISSYEIADFLATERIKTHGLGIGGSFQFPFGKVKLTIAFHSAGYAPRGEMEKGRFIYLGTAAGMLLTADGKTIYHAGDTALSLEMKLLGELNRIDLALLPIGDNFTMGPEDAAIAAEFLKAELSVPIHFNTWDLIRVDPQSFARRVKEKGLQAKVLSIGETLVL